MELNLFPVPDQNFKGGSSITKASNVQNDEFKDLPKSVTIDGVSLDTEVGSKVDLSVSKLVVDSVGKSGGLCMMWDNSIIIDILSYPPGHIDVRIQDKGNRVWRFTGFYGHLVQAEKLNSWILLRRLAGLYNLPWVVLGRFNEIICDSEKTEGTDKNWRDMAMFREVVDDNELEDMGNIKDGRLALSMANRADNVLSWKQIAVLEKKINLALDMEERYWLQRAKSDWL
ncbi:hypothetical protein Ddye_029222 [Dipteronia dyeriana]|uniref:Uncharacterized protein n=1 Tax=Dipteronia dyeriana TaxID=168575 RepID=A0AAD9TDZ3_9ROSI|nr:hypothetical protein Ddye_029222 [Dipteronia dyeriana]